MAWEIEETTINQENNDNTSPQWEIEDVNPMTQSVMDDRDQKVYNVPVSMDGIDATYAIDTQHNGADASNYFGKVEIVDKAAQSYFDNLKNSANPILALAGKVAEPVSEAGFAMQDANNPLKSIGRGALEPVDLVEDWAYSNIAKRKIKTEIESRQLKEGKISWWDVALRPDWLPNESVADELAAEMKKYRQGLKDIQAERKNKILPQEQMNEADQVIEGMFGALSQTGLSLGSVFVSGNPYAASALIAGMYGQVKKEDVWEDAISQEVNPFAAEVMGNISSIYEAGIEFAGDLVGAKFAKVMPIRNLASQTMQKAAIRLAQKAQAAGADGVIKSASKHLDSIIAGTLKGAAGEYGEEVLQNFGGDLLTNIYGLTQIDLGESFENANIAGLYAAFAGGVGGGGGTALHNRLAKKVNNKLIDTIKQTNPEIKEEEAQIIADGLQEVFYQEDAPEYAKELNKLNSKQIALMKEDKGLSEKNFAAETRKMLKEKYDMTDEQIDQTIKIGVNMIDMRNQYSKAYNYMREELELAGRTPQLADSEARIFAARMSAFARAEGLNLDDLLKERGVKVAQMKFADFMNGKRGKDSKSEMISLEDLQDLRNLKNTKQNSKERTSLLAFIKSKGGMRDSGGELKNMDAHKSYIGVINKNSKLGMDDMALAAWEAGYFEGQERPDINELLAAVKDELMGNPRYSSKDGYEKGQNREQELRELGKELEKIGVDYMNDSLAEVNRKMREAMDEADRMRTQASESEEYNSLNEDQQEQYAILRDRGATHREAMEAVRPSEEMPWFQESLDIAKENQRLDDIYPAYEGETITINGKERTVYNSNGDRIAKSKEALENFYRWFGDSKVVDEQGRPLVVYHGTLELFDAFDKERIGDRWNADERGFFFIDKENLAKGYARSDFDESRQGYVMPVYISAKKPLIVDSKTARKYGFDSRVFDREDSISFWDDYGAFLLENYADKNKNDAIIISDGYSRMVVAFEPNQIKSTSNRGTYSESENIYYQFAGEKAQTAALDELDRAKQLEADGVDNEEIRQQTGWFKGVDGKWRFEISDKDAEFYEAFNPDRIHKEGLFFDDIFFKLGKVLKHDKLFAAYPELKDLNFVYTKRMEQDADGNYDPATKTIYVKSGLNSTMAKYVLMHEIQHAIQHIEGFAFGGSLVTKDELKQHYKGIIEDYDYSPEMQKLERDLDELEFLYDAVSALEVAENPEKVTKKGWWQENVFGSPKGKARKEFIEEKAQDFINYIKDRQSAKSPYKFSRLLEYLQEGNLKDLKAEMRSLQSKVGRKMKKSYPEVYKDAKVKLYNLEDSSAFEIYKRLAGEIEARNTQSRMDYTEEQRRAESPESTQDIKNADAIVVFDDGTAMAYEPKASENIYYQEGDDRDLVALHSISASNLEKAIDFGGFPVPSIAIVKRGQEFHFDDLPITLVGNKEMIDPYDERNEVYNRDVWTKTFPWVTYKKPTQAKEKSFKNKIEEYYKRTNSENELGSFIYVAQRGDTSSALSQFQGSSGAMLYYLENIKKQKVEFAEKDLASDILERAGIDETLANEIQGLDVDTDRDKITKAFKRFLERKEEEDFSDIKDAEKREKMIKFSRRLANENYFDKEGNLYFAKADTIVTASDRYFSSKGKKFIDQYEVRRQLRDMIANDENYQEWATEFFEKELVGDKMVRVGNALKPFTLENVVDAMTTGATVASQETPLPAMGKVVAAGAKRLETIRDIKEEGKKLVTLEQSKENMEKVKETLYDFLNMFEKGDDFSRNMDRKDAVATALQGVLKNKNITKESLKKAILRQLPSDKTVSDEVLSYGVELANEIKGLARYYFEAKPQRAVGLNEFSAAIMPTSSEFDAIAKKVEDKGLKVIRSDDQVQALRDFDAEDRVFFQSAFHGSPYKELEGGKFDLKYAGKTTGNVHGHGVYAVVSKPSAEYWAGENGQVYELDVPEDFELIDEQKGFDEQPEKVRYAILGALEKINGFGLLEKAVLDNMPGGEIYVALGKDVFFDKHGYEGGSTEIMKAASEFLDKLGIKGITYDYANEKNFVIFNPDDVKVIQKFYQGNQSQTGRGGTARGAYSNNIIYLFEHADASTVIHELGHYFLDDLQKYGKSEKSQQQLQAIYNYLGAKDGVITNEMHEYFADSFEVYLKEGKAPNSLLRGVFIKFKNWLRRIFSEVKRLEGVKLTDEMRKTFDEMLGGKSLDFAMQTASENMQLNAKSGYIPPSVADFAIELISKGKMSRAQMDDILERLKTGDLARADVYKELKAIEAKDEQHGEQLDPFDKVKYKEALLKDNINKGKVLDKIETLMKWAQPRDINSRTVGRFPNKKMNDFFIEANRLMNLEKDEAKQKIDENKSTITAILESRELPNEKYSVLGMNFDKEADRPELLNALAIENRLLGVAAKNISLDNAIKLYNDLQDSYNEGRLTANVTGDLKRARKMKMREATIRVLLGDGKVNPKAEKGKVKQFLNRLGTSQMSWGGLMDILSMNDASRAGQSELSQMMDVFQEEQNNAQWVADDGEKFCKFFEAKLQGANNGTISVSKYINNELDKKTKLQWGKYSRTFTKDELIDIYMKSKDMETKEIMLHDEINGFDQGFLDLVNQNLNADDRAFADALFEFYNDNWAKINAFYEEKYGVTMPKNTYYSPRTMLREGISVSDGSPAFASSGFTKKRTAGKGASIDIQGAFRVWNNYVTNTNRWLAWSDKLMDINSVFGNREIKNIIANQWGDNMNSRIRGEIERMAGAKGDKFTAAFSSKLMTKIRGNYAKSVLALKPALMIKQLTSFPAYWNEMSAMDFAAGLADFFKHPKEAIEILGNTTLMKTRGTDIIRDFAEISKMDILKGKKGIKWSDAMMLNIKLGDRGAIYMGGWALYKSELKKNLAQGMSEEDAKAKALERFERVTDETQQSGRLSQQSYWQSNPALRMFTMFQSSQNQYLRKEIGAVRGALTGRMDKAQAAKTLFIFHVLLPCLFQFASDGFDWDKEAQLRAAVLGSLNGVFVLNSLLTKIYDHTINQWIFDEKPRYGSSQLGVREIVPFWASVEDLAKQFEKLADDDIDLTDMADAFEMFSKIAKPAGELAGLPLKYPLDVIKNFGNYAEEDKYRKELLLYLGWSPYALKENDNKIELLDF